MTTSTEPSIKELLIEIKELLSDKNNWCQAKFARNKNGDGIHYSSEEACSFCALGATFKIVNKDNPNPLQLSNTKEFEIIDLLDQISSELYPNKGNIICVNDYLGHKAVMKVFEKAIERAE